MQHTVHIDFETRSAVDLRRTGVYPYAADPTTDVLCACFSVDDDEEIQTWIPGQPVPSDIVRAVEHGWLMYAHNAAFERIVWRDVLATRYGWPAPSVAQFRCTMVMAMAMALPAALGDLVEALRLDIRKDMDGQRLMLQMCKPRGPRKAEMLGDAVDPALVDAHGLLWWEDEPRRERLYAYCQQDVEAEREAAKRLLPLNDSEQRLWQLDQRINDRGVGVDAALATAALKIVRDYTAVLNKELKKLTCGAVWAGTNVGQLMSWLADQGVYMEDLTKASVAEALGGDNLTPDARRALEIRQSVGRTSVTKINSLLAGMDKDGRARGLLQFHAASTGRWGGRRFQPQNIKRPSLKDVEPAINLVALGDWEAVDLAYGDPLGVVGDCLRGMVRADSGAILLASDFANIEGRGLAWLAGEQWKLDAFRDYDNGTGPDIYKLAYARAFYMDYEEITTAQRQIGKVMELALGFEGGVGAFKTMGAIYNIQVSDAEANDLKQKWRAAHPATRDLWRSLADAARDAVAAPGVRVEVNGKIAFMKRGSFLFMRLPSGRVLSYPYPRLVEMVWVECKATGKRRTMLLSAAKHDKEVEFDADQAYQAVVYYGQNSKTRQWGDVSLYGGILAENAVQALSRDILAEAMLRVESAGYPIVLTVHDEIVAEVPKDMSGCREVSLEKFNALMSTLPAWAQGFPIAAAGWKGERYRK